MKLLVTDDTKALHAYIDSVFAQIEQIELQHAYNGDEAIAILKNADHGFDLVLLDWEMPGRSGPDTLFEIRKFDEVPVIMVTTRNHGDDFTDAFEKGANEYVMKPFTPDILIGKIEMVLGQKIVSGD